MKDIVNFLFEVGMLKKTPRTGYQFFGSGEESVAEHVMRTAVIGYTLAKLDGEADAMRVMALCLFHDLPEARTGDLNYINKKYVTVHEDQAVKDLAGKLPFGEDIVEAIQEFNQRETLEAKLAHDADQLDLLLQIKEHGDVGNRYADDWLYHALNRLETDMAKKLAEEVLQTDSTAWWFGDKRGSYWSRKK